MDVGKGIRKGAIAVIIGAVILSTVVTGLIIWGLILIF